ncbi:MAG: carbohydrate ABC transporter permease [Clostridiales bacterium]|nr:carbohydrate ABC transporter permease [Clostridiales bacterium]
MKNTSSSLPGSSVSYYLGRICWKLFRALLMICLAFVILYPILYMVSMAFRTVEDVYSPQVVWIPNQLTLHNIVFTAEVLDYWKLLGRTIFISGTSTLAQIFVCSMVGYGLGRFQNNGFSVVIGVLLLTIIVPQQIIALPTYFNFQSVDFFGIIQLITGEPSKLTLLGTPFLTAILALFGQGIRSGLIILIFRQAYHSMPKELEDAAMVDGSGFLGTYFKIMVPNAVNVILVCFLFTLVWYWNDYYITSIYIGNFPTLAVRIAGIRPAFQVATGNAAFDPYYMVVVEQAACLMMILPVLVLYIFTQKYFTESIEKTGLVG